jgi:hypothetical protein
MKITADELRSLLSYNPETGLFIWLQRTSNRIEVGGVAGHPDPKSGYSLIGIKGRVYKASRLAWLYMTGEWPPNRIDHINRDRLDDRWANLRACSHSQNMANTGIWKHNTSGVKGVHLHAETGRWRARIAKDGKSISLGLYATPEEAGEAYRKAAIKLYGEFAAT